MFSLHFYKNAKCKQNAAFLENAHLSGRFIGGFQDKTIIAHIKQKCNKNDKKDYFVAIIPERQRRRFRAAREKNSHILGRGKKAEKRHRTVGVRCLAADAIGAFWKQKK